MLRNASVLDAARARARLRRRSTRSAAPRPGARSMAARRRSIPFVTSWYKGFREQNVFKHSTTA